MAAAATFAGVPATSLMVDAWGRHRLGPGRAVPGPVGEVLLFRPPHQVPEPSAARILATGSPAVVLRVVVPVPGLHPRRARAVVGGEDAAGDAKVAFLPVIAGEGDPQVPVFVGEEGHEEPIGPAPYQALV